MDGEELGLLGSDSGDTAESDIGSDSAGGDSGQEIADEETPQQESPESEGGREEEAERKGAAERSLPLQLRKAIRELSTANPEFAKRFPRLERQLTAALFRDQQYTKMGGMQQLRTAAEALEAHGGMQGIQDMAEQVEASQYMEQGFREGDPVAIDTWASEYPDGFKRSVGYAIGKLESMDLAAHDRELSGPLYKTLDRCGVIGTAADLEAAIAGERFEDINKHFAALKNFLVELRNFSQRAKAPDPLKGEREQLMQERESIQSERRTSFFKGVENEVGNQVTSLTNRLLRQELSGRTVRSSTMVTIRKLINEGLASAVNTAPGYTDRYKAVMNAGDHNRSVKFITQAARAKLPGIVKQVLRDFNLGAVPSAPRRAAAGSVREGGTSRTVAGRPKTADVDFTRTDKAGWLGSFSLQHGSAYLKDGRLAKW